MTAQREELVHPGGTEVRCALSPTRCTSTIAHARMHASSAALRPTKAPTLQWGKGLGGLSARLSAGGRTGVAPGPFFSLALRAVGEMKGKFGDTAVFSVKGRKLWQIKYLSSEFEEDELKPGSLPLFNPSQ